jgi:hypothetical protein
MVYNLLLVLSSLRHRRTSAEGSVLDVQEYFEQGLGGNGLRSWYKVTHGGDDVVQYPWEPAVLDSHDPKPEIQRLLLYTQPFDAPYVVRKFAGLYPR